MESVVFGDEGTAYASISYPYQSLCTASETHTYSKSIRMNKGEIIRGSSCHQFLESGPACTFLVAVSLAVVSAPAIGTGAADLATAPMAASILHMQRGEWRDAQEAAEAALQTAA